MDLLKDIDTKAQTREFELFLEALDMLDANMEDELTAQTVHEEIEHLQEIGRGDYAAHMDMAAGRGVSGRAENPGVEKALANPRLGLRPKSVSQAAPQEGQRVVFVGPGNQRYAVQVVSAFEDMVTLKGKDGKRYKVDRAQLKAARDKAGGMGFVTRKMPQPLQYSAMAAASAK